MKTSAGKSGSLFDVVLPTYNEEGVLRANVTGLMSFLRKKFGQSFVVIIADGGSLDGTRAIALELEHRFKPQVRFIDMGVRGRGLAIARAWDSSGARLHTYMDIDLSTDLGAFPKMIHGLQAQADLVIADRFHPDSTRVRSAGRELLSRGYNALARMMLGIEIDDFQCGFKGIKDRAWRQIRGRLKAEHWFFDTELIYRCTQQRLRIVQLAVDWKDSTRFSNVRILSTIKDFLCQLIELRFSG